MMLIPLITKGAERVAETDPHGLTLTLISVAGVIGSAVAAGIRRIEAVAGISAESHVRAEED